MSWSTEDWTVIRTFDICFLAIAAIFMTIFYTSDGVNNLQNRQFFFQL